MDGELVDAPTPELAFAAFLRGLQETYRRLPPEYLAVLARRHGTACGPILDGVREQADLGRHFGGNLYEREVTWLQREEWAVTAEDILWRRTKEGLHTRPDEQRALADWLAAHRSNIT